MLSLLTRIRTRARLSQRETAMLGHTYEINISGLTQMINIHVCTLISIHSHWSISLVVVSASRVGTVDWNLVVVCSQAMTMGVRIRK